MADKNTDAPVDAPVEEAPINLTKIEAVTGYDQSTGAFSA